MKDKYSHNSHRIIKVIQLWITRKCGTFALCNLNQPYHMTHDHRQGDLCNACNKLLYNIALKNKLCMVSQTNAPFTKDAHLVV